MLAPLGPWRGIVAITRGGMIPAAIVARELECRLVETVCVAATTRRRAATRCAEAAAAAGDGAGFLVIDDLVDRGATARLVRGLLPRAHFACLYAKPAGQALADSFVVAVAQDVWVLFPWDTRRCLRAADRPPRRL